MVKKYVVWFTDVDKNDGAIVGGKGANLGEMTQAGFPVPPGFIVTVQAYETFLEEAKLQDKISELLSGINVNDSTSLDLAAANIFTGDMLLKNFGVTRHGRVIFYDYDELCLLTDCRFRELPAPRDDYEDGAAEPWFHVGERDIFPQEFRAFLGLKGELLDTFLARHADLLGVRFWHGMQDRHRRGEIPDIFPYDMSRRLHAPARTHQEETAS